MTKRVAIRRPSFIEFQTECGVGDTFDPSITLRSGCPYTPRWSFGNRDTATGASVSYAGFADAGPHTIRLTLPRIDYWLTGIDVYNDKITGDFLAALTACVSLQTIRTGENTNLASDIASIAGLTDLTTLDLREHQFLMTGDIANLASLSKLTYIYAAGTGLYGDIASLAGMTQLSYLDIHSNDDYGGVHGALASIASLTNLGWLQLGNTFVTGSLADLAPLTRLTHLQLYGNQAQGTGLVSGTLNDLAPFTSLQYVRFEGCQSVTGGTLPVECGASIYYVDLRNMAWDQATVDACLASLYTNRAAWTRDRLHYLLLTGNVEPSGIYQDAAQPSTGREYIYKLEVDPDGNGFPLWSISYTGE